MNASDLLMLSGTERWCEDCAGLRVFVPVDGDHDLAGDEFCCTTCSAAVLLLPGLAAVDAPTGSTSRRHAG